MKHYGRFMFAVVVWGAITFGAVYPWAYWPLVGACALLGVLGVRTDDDHTGWLGWLGIALLTIALGAGLQLIPLPRSVLLAIGGATDRFLQNYILGYARNPPSSHSLSIAPQHTILGLTLFLGFSIFLLGLIRRVPHIGLENAARRLTIFAVVMAVFAVVQRGLSGANGTELVYGFWKPTGAGNVFGPFINRNHFAGWMVMAAPIAMGYALGHLDRGWPKGRGGAVWSRWLGSTDGSRFVLSVLAALAMGASIVISGSRSGMASFVVAVAVTAVFVWRGFFRRASGALFIGVATVALVLAVFTWAGLGTALNRFSTASEDAGGRIGAWRDTTRIIRDFPIFGVGLNSYGTAMLIYQSGDRRLFYREAHNDYLQVMAEGGVLLSLPAFAAIVIVAYQISRRFREGRDPPMTSWIRAGAVAALAGIAVQSAIEFSLQIPGNTVLFLVIVAIAVHRPIRSARAMSLAQRAA